MRLNRGWWEGGLWKWRWRGSSRMQPPPASAPSRGHRHKGEAEEHCTVCQYFQPRCIHQGCEFYRVHLRLCRKGTYQSVILATTPSFSKEGHGRGVDEILGSILPGLAGKRQIIRGIGSMGRCFEWMISSVQPCVETTHRRHG